MSLVVTSPLQKCLPTITPTVTPQNWERLISSFIAQRQDETVALIGRIDKNILILENQKERSNILIGILEEAGGLTVRARNLMTTAEDAEKYELKIKEFEDWFKLTQKKFDKATEESSFDGINLMNGDTLVTSFDSKGLNKLVTEGLVLTCESLGIRTPDFSTTFTLQNARIDVMNAIDIVVTVRNIIAGHISNLTISRDFAIQSNEMAKDSITTLVHSTLESEMAGLQKLTETGNQFLNGEPLADQAQQDILDSFAESPMMEDI